MTTTLITPDISTVTDAISTANLIHERVKTFPAFLGEEQCFAVAVALADIHKKSNSSVKDFMHDVFIWGFLEGWRAHEEGRLEL